MRRSTALLIAALCAPASAHAGKAFDTEAASGNDLLETLGHGAEEFRLDATKEIKRRCIVEADAPLAGLAESDPSRRVRLSALVALDHCAMPSALTTAEAVALVDFDAGNRRKALAVIERRGTARSAPVLSQVLLGDPDLQTARKAAVVLRSQAWSGAEPVQEEVAATSPDRVTRTNAAHALLILDRARYTALFHDRLRKEPDARARRDLVEILEKEPTPGDKDILVTMLDDDDPHVARHAARALVRLGDPSVAAILKAKSLDVRDRKVAEEFAEAASLLGG